LGLKPKLVGNRKKEKKKKNREKLYPKIGKVRELSLIITQRKGEKGKKEKKKKREESPQSSYRENQKKGQGVGLTHS